MTETSGRIQKRRRIQAESKFCFLATLIFASFSFVNVVAFFSSSLYFFGLVWLMSLLQKRLLAMKRHVCYPVVMPFQHDCSYSHKYATCNKTCYIVLLFFLVRIICVVLPSSHKILFDKKHIFSFITLQVLHLGAQFNMGFM